MIDYKKIDECLIETLEHFGISKDDKDVEKYKNLIVKLYFRCLSSKNVYLKEMIEYFQKRMIANNV